jgi:hypothetical protein
MPDYSRPELLLHLLVLSVLEQDVREEVEKETKDNFRLMAATVLCGETPLCRYSMSMLAFWVSAPRGLVYVHSNVVVDILPPSSALKVEAVCTSELLSIYKYIRRCNPEDKNTQLHRHENLKSPA